MKLANNQKVWGVYALALINALSGLLHLVFNVRLLKLDNEYSGFMIIENAMVALVFMYSCYMLIWSTSQVKQLILRFQVVWWAVFCTLVVFNWGSVSTLHMFHSNMPLSESTCLLVTGLVAVVLSVYSSRLGYEKNYNDQASSVTGG